MSDNKNNLTIDPVSGAVIGTSDADNVFPIFGMSCEKCGKEFEHRCDWADLDNVVCPDCGGKANNTYISFPEDGPGFKDDYNSDKLINGCGGDCDGCGDLDLCNTNDHYKMNYKLGF